MTRSKKPERWRIKLVANVIRQVRGKPLLEALYNLQGGYCAYDRKPCLLLLQPTEEIEELGLSITKEMRSRCATIDHVIPRARGGANNLHNYVMASQVRNCEKGALDPTDEWTPLAKRWSVKAIEAEIIRVEQSRWQEAMSLARHVSSKADAKKVIVAVELKRLYGPDKVEIYMSRRDRKIQRKKRREENGEKTQSKTRPRRWTRSVRPRRTIKE